MSDWDELFDLRKKYDELFAKRISELQLPEEEKTLPGTLFVSLERELYRDLLKLRVVLGIDDRDKISTLVTRKQKRRARKRGERGRRYDIKIIKTQDDEIKGVA